MQVKPNVHEPPEVQGQPKAPTGHCWGRGVTVGGGWDVVGGKVGLRVGKDVGDDVGMLVGCAVGSRVGKDVGDGVGMLVGCAVGSEVGFGVIKVPIAGVEMEVRQRTR